MLPRKPNWQCLTESLFTLVTLNTHRFRLPLVGDTSGGGPGSRSHPESFCFWGLRLYSSPKVLSGIERSNLDRLTVLEPRPVDDSGCRQTTQICRIQVGTDNKRQKLVKRLLEKETKKRRPRDLQTTESLVFHQHGPVQVCVHEFWVGSEETSLVYLVVRTPLVSRDGQTLKSEIQWDPFSNIGEPRS